MSNNITFELAPELTGSHSIKGEPEVMVFSRTDKAAKPAKAYMYKKSPDGVESVFVEYADRSAHKWVTLESLQRDNGNAIRVLFGAENGKE